MKKPLPGQDAAGQEPDAMPVLEESLHARTTSAEEVIPLAEEVLQVRVTGKIRVQTLVETVEELARASLQTDSVEVTRIPMDQIVDTPPTIRTEDDVMIVPVFEEVLVVEKRLVLKEELHIRRHVSTEEVEIPVSLRKQRAVVERIDPDGSDADNM
jgi:stress response protein YsnF